MRLIRRVVLHFQQGKSDKVYEVDLAEVAPDRFVVNFRYGRRGTTLKEGAKTLQAVPRAQAERIFDDLVAEKVGKGYQEVGGTPAAPEAAASRPAFDEPAAVLQRLATGTRLKRTIWRAGEMGLADAVPYLLALMGRGDALQDYCVAWALGRIADPRGLEALRRTAREAAPDSPLGRIAEEGLYRTFDASGKREMRRAMAQIVPEPLRPLVADAVAAWDATPPDVSQPHQERIVAALAALPDETAAPALHALYRVRHPGLIDAVAQRLAQLPFHEGTFKYVRWIFKAAEFRRDARVYGVLTKRFDRTREHASNAVDNWWAWQNRNKQAVPERWNPYSRKTREWMRRRCWRTLRRLGELGDPDYVRLAVGVLLAYEDADALEPFVREIYSYNGPARRIHFGEWRYDVTFGHILFDNAVRYDFKNMKWRCVSPYKPGGPKPAAREEAYPHLWEAVPTRLVYLLTESRCAPVHEFAVAAITACTNFWPTIADHRLALLFGAPYAVTARLALSMLRLRYKPDAPSAELLVAAASACDVDVRQQAHAWIDQSRQALLQNPLVAISLATSPYDDTRAFARRLLMSTALDEQAAVAVVGRLLAFMLEADATDDIMNDVADTVLRAFPAVVRHLGMPALEQLVTHPRQPVAELGANILTSHAGPVSDEVMAALLRSPYETVRGIGVRLLGELSDDVVKSRLALLVALATHPLADLRNAVRPVIARLASDRGFASALVEALVAALLQPEPEPGTYDTVVALLREDIHGWQQAATPQIALRLVASTSPAAQEIGGLLLTEHAPTWAPLFDTATLVRFNLHAVMAVREAGRAIFGLTRARFVSEEELGTLAASLDTPWEDTRDFYRREFPVLLEAAGYPYRPMLALCDSVRAEAQAFGRDMLTKHLREEDTPQVLLALSEHPAPDMQRFVTHFLARASDRPEQIEALVPFFNRVLSGINRGAVARGRVLDFLEAECMRSEAAARAIAPIAARASASIAVRERSRSIEIMLRIRRAWPQVDGPLQTVGLESRRAF